MPQFAVQMHAPPFAWLPSSAPRGLGAGGWRAVFVCLPKVPSLNQGFERADAVGHRIGVVVRPALLSAAGG